MPRVKIRGLITWRMEEGTRTVLLVLLRVVITTGLI
jgi:hypothetical protein